MKTRWIRSAATALVIGLGILSAVPAGSQELRATLFGEVDELLAEGLAGSFRDAAPQRVKGPPAPDREPP